MIIGKSVFNPSRIDLLDCWSRAYLHCVLVWFDGTTIQPYGYSISNDSIESEKVHVGWHEVKICLVDCALFFLPSILYYFRLSTGKNKEGIAKKIC